MCGGVNIFGVWVVLGYKVLGCLVYCLIVLLVFVVNWFLGV